MTQDAPQTASEPCLCVARGLRVLAVVADYPALHAALRARQAELGVGYGVLNDISGLSYCDKLLAPMPIGGPVARNGRPTPRGIGPLSLGPLLQALGLVLVVAEDPVQTERIKSLKMFKRRGENYVTASVSSIDELIRAREAANRARQLAQARAAIDMSPEQRQRRARKAARIRWEIERRARRIAKRIERATRKGS